jgi:protein tyrosine/serine phosphatase
VTGGSASKVDERLMTTTTRATGQRLAWDACYNARDLGGYPTMDGGRTRWQALVRADNLARLTAAGRAALVAYGVRTIIDVRNPFELTIDPNPFADAAPAADVPAYRHLPFEDETDADGQALITAAETGAGVYAVMLDRNQARVGAIVAAIAGAPDGTVLVHCHAGKDRTGLVSALLLALAGASSQTIADDYARSDVHLQPLYDAYWASTDDLALRARVMQRWGRPVENMLALLADLETRHGGARAYLRAAGVDDASLARLRARLRDDAPPEASR